MITRTLFVLCILFAAPLPTNATAPEPSDELKLLGWLERVNVYPSGLTLRAKLDTGADSCSVHAENIRKYSKKEDERITFTITDDQGQTVELDRKIVRSTRIKTKSGGAQVRPVVRLGICVSHIYEVVECNLVDRSHFENPVLLGRNFLSGSILVNSSTTFTENPSCKDIQAPK